MNNIGVFPSNGDPVGPFDLLVTALGYETRSTFVARLYSKNSTNKIAVSFEYRLEASYTKNKQFYNDAGFLIIRFATQNFINNFINLVKTSIIDSSNPRLLVDISSMSRPMIASIGWALKKIGEDCPISVEFTYCPAEYTEQHSSHNPVTVSEPVIPELAGWSSEPNKSVGAIFGLGFEHDQALGTMEYLEPAAVWTFAPTGEDRRYDAAVAAANQSLYEILDSSRMVEYNLLDPFKCFVEVEALTYGVTGSMRPVLVPFGPKIFALICVLVGIIHHPNVAIWRVSGDQLGNPEDRTATGRILSLKTLFSGSEEPAIRSD